MRLTVFGNVGGRVVNEALSRGHEVTAVIRRAGRAGSLPADAAIRIGDIGHLDDVVAASTGQDVVVAATRPPAGQEPDLIASTRTLLAALAGSGVRLLVVGGAGGLTVPGTDELVVDDTDGSWISLEDLAVALVDEVERPKHHRSRFTIGY